MTELNSIDEVYKSALYGALHKEARINKLLKKFGSKYADRRLSSKDLKKAVSEIEAIDSLEKSSGISIEFKNKEISLLKKIIRENLKNIKKIPKLSREQTIISLCVVFEGFISDLLRTIFNSNIDTLKSTRSTLKEEDVIDSIKKGDTLEKLKEYKIRDIMYGSVDNWIGYFQKQLRFKIDININIVELFLVRNCLIHNKKIVNSELENKVKKKRYISGKEINITKNDYNRYRDEIKKYSKLLWEEYIAKFSINQ